MPVVWLIQHLNEGIKLQQWEAQGGAWTFFWTPGHRRTVRFSFVCPMIQTEMLNVVPDYFEEPRGHYVWILIPDSDLSTKRQIAHFFRKQTVFSRDNELVRLASFRDLLKSQGEATRQGGLREGYRGRKGFGRTRGKCPILWVTSQHIPKILWNKTKKDLIFGSKARSQNGPEQHKSLKVPGKRRTGVVRLISGSGRERDSGVAWGRQGDEESWMCWISNLCWLRSHRARTRHANHSSCLVSELWEDTKVHQDKKNMHKPQTQKVTGQF